MLLLSRKFLRSKPRVITSTQVPGRIQHKGYLKTIHTFFKIILFRSAEFNVGISEGIIDELNRYNPRGNIRLIPNSVSIDTNHSNETSLNENTFVFVGVGRLCEQKAFDRLIRAFKLTVDKCSDKNLNLFIYGEGPLRDNLKKLISELKLTGKVKLMGWCSNMDEIYNNADCFVLSSEYEGFGNVIIEAMAYGLPIVSVDCNFGPKDILGDSEFGLLCSLNDESLAYNMTKVVKNTELREYLQNQALSRCTNYSIAAVAKEYEKII